MQGLHILSLGREDPLEEEITTHSSIIFYLFPLFLIIYFNWRIITLQYCDGFHHTPTWIGHSYTRVPPSWNPHPIPLGCSIALALGARLHALNLHWSSVLHMVMSMFQHYSLKSSHPCFLPLSPKVCSLHLCLLCCPACMIIIAIFLNSIYMH